MTEAWPVYGYDPGHTGHGTDVTPPDGPVQQRWVHDLGGRFAYGPPVVGEQRWPGGVYVHGLMTQVKAPNVRAVECDEGALRWALDTGVEYGHESCSPTFAGEFVLLPGGWAVEARTGGRVWQTDAFDRRPVTAADGLVHIGFSALSLETGEERWSVALDEPMVRYVADGETKQVERGPGGGTPAVVGGTVFVAGRTREGIVHLDRSDGVWDDCEERGHLHALDADDGTVRWMTEFETPVTNSMTSVADGMSVYVVDANATVRAFDAEDGRERWRASTDANLVARPAVADGRVFVRGRSDELRALADADGSVEWRRDVGGPIVGAPAVVDGVVYLARNDGAVIAVDAADGTIRWRFDVDDTPGASVDALYGSGPVVSDGRVYVAGYQLHCLESRA